jgi:hypothetical protein
VITSLKQISSEDKNDSKSFINLDVRKITVNDENINKEDIIKNMNIIDWSSSCVLYKNIITLYFCLPGSIPIRRVLSN